MTSNPSKDERTHPESPAEGDPGADPADDMRVHAQEPAEGADPDKPEADKA